MKASREKDKISKSSNVLVDYSSLKTTLNSPHQNDQNEEENPGSNEGKEFLSWRSQ